MIINKPLWNTTVKKLDATLAAQLEAGEPAREVLYELLHKLGFRLVAERLIRGATAYTQQDRMTETL